MNGDASRKCGHCNPKQIPHYLILHCFQYPIIITKASTIKSIKGKLKKSVIIDYYGILLVNLEPIYW